MMLTLNLIDPLRSDISFQSKVFPDGQINLVIDTAQNDFTGKEVRIVTRLSHANDLLLCLYALDVLKYNGASETDLYVTYLTTARMDRVMTNGEPFSLRVIARILNGTGFRRIIIFDPHSPVSTALIERCYAINNKQFVAAALDKLLQTHPQISREDLLLISPDAGALKKIYDVSEYLWNMPVIECNKSRDVETGKLKSFTVFSGDLKGKTCLMVDDILDGGGTFAGIASVLKERNAAHIFAIVSHAIFSKGFYIDEVEEIYATDSYRYWPELPDHIHILPVEPFLLSESREQLPFL